MANKFMDIDGIKEFLNKVVTAPTATDVDNVLATKDGKLVQTDSTEIASSGLKLYKEDTADSVITLLDRLQITTTSIYGHGDGVSIRAIGTLDDLTGLINLNALHYLNYLGTIGTLNTLDRLNTLNYLGSLNTLNYLGSLDTLNYLGSLNSLGDLGTIGTLHYLNYLGTIGTLHQVYKLNRVEYLDTLDCLGTAHPMAEIRAVDTYLNDDGVHYLASVGIFNEDIGAAKLILGYDYEGNRSVGIYKCTDTDGSNENSSKYLKLAQIIRNIEKVVDYMEDKPKHIQYVSALPDSPDEDTLYLIPESEETTEITVDFSMSSVQYATLMLPFNYELPEGLTAYEIVEIVDKETGEVRYEGATTSLIADKPYVIHGTTSSIGSYQFTGVPTANIKYKYNNGILVGTYKILSEDDGDFRKDGTEYILQAVNGEATWCPITSESVGISVGAYRCYIDTTLK